MGLLDLLGRKRARDKSQNSYEGQDFSYLFGRTTSGENVDELKAMQTTAVYACVRILAEAVASLPIHVYELTSNGKEKKIDFRDVSISAINEIKSILSQMEEVLGKRE